MKHCKKLTLLLIAALLLAAALMTGCASLTPAQDTPADAEADGGRELHAFLRRQHSGHRRGTERLRADRYGRHGRSARPDARRL